MIIGLISEDGSMDRHDLQDYAKANIEKILARVPGVGEVGIFGSGYAMRIWVNPHRLTDYQLTIDDVITALRAYNVEVSAGQLGGAPAVEGQRLNASIVVQNMLKTPDDSGADPIRTIRRDRVRVRDIGRTDWGPRPTTSSVPQRQGGRPCHPPAAAPIPGHADASGTMED
jgi:HAE1 family hydrophobic/amphiphilic exporter-1